MKLIIAIVQDKFVNNLIKEFLEVDIRITKLSSTGGFLKEGNTTFLIGVEDDNVELAKNIIKNAVKSEVIDEDHEKLTVRGAHLFVIDVDKSLTF